MRNLNGTEWLTIVGAVMIAIFTARGAVTHDWEVYCWMATLILWVYIASQRRRGLWR